MAGKGESSGTGNVLLMPELVELLEKVYYECQNPNQSQILEMIHKYPKLSIIEPKKIKRWFHSRRLLEKLKNMELERRTVMGKLAATQQLLMAENARLHQELLQLEDENKYIRHLLQNASASNTAKSCESAYSPHSLEAADNLTRSFSFAEESHTELLIVSKRSAIGRFPTPRMKVLHCIVQLVEEKSGKLTPVNNKEALLLSFSQQSTGRLSTLNGDVQSLRNYDTDERLIMTMKLIKKFGIISSFTAAPSFRGTVLCVKVSLLLKCEKLDMVTAKSTKNLKDSFDAQCLMAPIMPDFTEVSMFADWICKSFRSNKGSMLLKSNSQSQESAWEWLWCIKGNAVLLTGICKSAGAI